MALLKIVVYPDPVLAKKAQPIRQISAQDKKLFRDMIDTMYEGDGVGLAAPQVGVSKQIIVISPNAKRGEERILINPQVLDSSGSELGVEGCLSLPGVSGDVLRATTIKLHALDEQGREINETFYGFAARVIQHEIDHLNGILLIDRFDFDKRQEVLSNYLKL